MNQIDNKTALKLLIGKDVQQLVQPDISCCHNFCQSLRSAKIAPSPAGRKSKLSKCWTDPAGGGKEKIKDLKTGQ